MRVGEAGRDEHGVAARDERRGVVLDRRDVRQRQDVGQPRGLVDGADRLHPAAGRDVLAVKKRAEPLRVLALTADDADAHDAPPLLRSIPGIPSDYRRAGQKSQRSVQKTFIRRARKLQSKFFRKVANVARFAYNKAEMSHGFWGKRRANPTENK